MALFLTRRCNLTPDSPAAVALVQQPRSIGSAPEADLQSWCYRAGRDSLLLAAVPSIVLEYGVRGPLFTRAFQRSNKTIAFMRVWATAAPPDRCWSSPALLHLLRFPRSSASCSPPARPPTPRKRRRTRRGRSSRPCCRPCCRSCCRRVRGRAAGQCPIVEVPKTVEQEGIYFGVCFRETRM